MKSTFNLKKSNKANLSLILFSAYFKEEDRKFIYSTGELIDPKEWDKVNKQTDNINGRTKGAENHRTIDTQIKRYSAFFNDTIANYKLAKRDITIAEIRAEFDKEFKKTSGISNKFFLVYDKYVKEKENDYSDEAVSITTIKRFQYNKKLLIELEEKRKKKISFNQINKTFYNDFLKFCIEEKRHSANTLRRNVGLLKTFLYWALENNHTYKVDFQKFKAPKAQQTDEIALAQSDIDKVFEFDLSKNIKLERVRDLFILGCSTGLRISNYSKIRKQDIINESIQVRDEKNKDKNLSIPLNDYSKYILEKYDFQLPKISTQKFNEYIKEVFIH
jgi:site-specific recombinase XerD